MKLTPIRVRGKGGKKTLWTAPDPQRILKRKRIDYAISDDSESDAKRRRRLRTTKKPAAPIELLPSEVLERILFMSRNFNLLRSSSRIGYRFSSRSFLIGLVEDAFAPTWEVWFGCPRDQISSYNGFLCDHDRIGGDYVVQENVLNFPWLNLPAILEAQQRWYRKHGTGRYFEHLVPLTSSVHSDSEPGHHPLGGPGHAMDVEACFEADWNEFTSAYSVLLSGDAAELNAIPRSFLHGKAYIDVHPITSIPDSLIRGPFDLQRAKLLFWLIRGGARLGQPSSWETAKCGYENITALGDKRLAVHLLGLFHELNVFHGFWPDFVREEKLAEAERRYESADPMTLAGRLWWFARELLKQSWRY
ncbi:hypothetical protein VTK26DRAFT_8254 [Humicola hyalothermophila]